MGQQRPYAEFFSQGKGLVVAVRSVIIVRSTAMPMDFTKQLEGIYLVSLFLMRLGELEGTPYQCARLAYASSQEISLAEMNHPERVVAPNVLGRYSLHRLF